MDYFQNNTSSDDAVEEVMTERPAKKHKLGSVKKYRVRVKVRKRNYENIEDLCLHLTDEVQKSYNLLFRGRLTPRDMNLIEPVTFRYNPELKRVQIFSDSKKVEIEMVEGTKILDIFGVSRRLKVLDRAGIKNYHLVYIKLPCTGEIEPSLPSEHPSIYIYCDIVQHQIVGDTMANLLRTLPITGDSGVMQRFQFHRPFYVRVAKGYISTVEIGIHNDRGEQIKFEGGKSILVLHFRRTRL